MRSRLLSSDYEGRVVEGQGPEGPESFGCVDCSAAFSVEAVDVMDWLWQAMRSALGCSAVQAGFGRARAGSLTCGNGRPGFSVGRHVGVRGMTYAIPLSGVDGGLTRREWR